MHSVLLYVLVCMDVCAPHGECWCPNLGPLREQQVFLSAEPPHGPILSFDMWDYRVAVGLSWMEL